MTETSRHLETHLVHHCNLNCIGCSHFSPLARGTWFADVHRYERDIRRIAELSFPFGGIFLMGGEPLLHPKLCQFLPVTRHYFPEKAISIVTNGILLPSVSRSFWEHCHAHSISISITRYPIALNIESIRKLASENSVKLIVDGEKNQMRVKHFDAKGNRPAKENFRNCLVADCTNFVEGKIFRCNIAAYVHILNKKLKTGLPEEIGIDIHKERITKTEIVDYLNAPTELCRFCVTAPVQTAKWQRSEQKKDEWIF